MKVDSMLPVLVLQGEFEMLHREDMPMLIREHARKYQWTMVECTVWRRL